MATNETTDATKRVAVLIEQHVEDSEFQIPYNALREAGAEVTVLGSRVNETYQGKNMKVSQKADRTTTDALAEEFDCVVIPGGMAPDRMRTNMKTVRFVQDAVEQGKLVAAVCHGPQVLIEGELLRGRRATGFRAIRKETSRRPADLPVFTAAILKRLGLEIKGKTLLDTNDPSADWWQLAEGWGGSTKAEIADALNTAIRGERYGLTAFEHYADKAADGELKSLFTEVCESKRRHIALLESRLAALGEKEGLQAAGSGAWATLKSWLQSSSELALLQRAMGDLQTGVVDAFNLTTQLTDPVTTAVFDEIEVAIAKQEQRVADIYHARRGREKSEAAKPTTGAAVTA
ncbi:MAG: DJ-1/PfpI family protein [Acidobacteria bacterium]|nr:DJ-1/PfpI family protein [Acidobacteriota bacterium]